MLLETMHNSKFYEGKAEKHFLLKRVIEGEGRLTDLLDSLMRTSYEPDFFHDCYLPMLKDLYESEGVAINKSLPSYNENIEFLKVIGISGVGGLSTVTLTGALLLLFPPTAPVGLVLVAAGTGIATGLGGIVWSLSKQDKLSKASIKKKRENILKPLYEIAGQLDTDISHCFIMNHFHNTRPRFEETYRALSGDEREVVNKQLFRYLGVGGMPGMDEIQLNEYLEKLPEPEAEGGV